MWEEDRTLWFDSVVADGKYLWFPAPEYNALYQYNREDNSTKYIGKFKGEKNSAFRLFSDICQVGERFYFSPSYAQEIGVYDREKDEFESIPLRQEGEELQTSFGPVKEYGDFLYTVSVSGVPVILELEKETGEITYYDNWYLDKNPNERFVGNEVLLKDGFLYLPFTQTNIVMKFDLTSKQFFYCRVGETDRGFNTICLDKDVIWLSARDCVLAWEEESGRCQRYDRFPEGFGAVTRDGQRLGKVKYTKGIAALGDLEFPFGHSVPAGDFVWFFPFRTNMVVKADIRNGNMESFPLPEETENEESLYMMTRFTHEKFPCVRLIGGKIYACSTKRLLLYCIDPGTGEVEEMRIKAAQPSILHLSLEELSVGAEASLLINEDKRYAGLRNFIKGSLIADNTVDAAGNETNYGKDIHAYIKSLLE